MAPGDEVIQYDDAYAAEPYAETVVDDPYAEPDADGTEEVFDEEVEDTAVEPAEDVYLDGPGYGFYPTEADPYDPYAEAPVEVYGPEEVVGPEEVEGPEDAEGPEDGGTLTVDGFSANAGVDYIPTFGQAVNSEARSHPASVSAWRQRPHPLVFASGVHLEACVSLRQWHVAQPGGDADV